MLLDLSFSNLFLENLGATVDNLVNLSNIVIYNVNGLNFENLYNLTNILNL